MCHRLLLLLITLTSSEYVVINKDKNRKPTIFREENVIFNSGLNITKLLVPTDGHTIGAQSSEIPSILFTVSDPKLYGGACIYILEGFAAFEILEGGRDATSDYGFTKNVYLGGKDGIYEYIPESFSAQKYGAFSDDIIQLQKANGSDAIFILTTDKKIYRIDKHGTVKTRIENIICATEFVLDTSDNIYYLSCNDDLPHIIKYDGTMLSLTASVMEDFKTIKLLRPAFIMEDSIPFFADGTLHVLYANGTCEVKEFHLEETPSAFSVDAGLYMVVALNGKIYEYNVMEVLLKSIFGVVNEWPKDVTGMVMSIIDNAKEQIIGAYNI